MDRFMHRRHSPSATAHRAMVGVESLEGRWLLSRLPLSSSGGTESPAAEMACDGCSFLAEARHPASVRRETVAVVNVEPVADDEGPEGALAPQQIPPQVINALQARFPGVTIAEGERTTDGDREAYEISASWAGLLLDVTISPRGAIIETKQSVRATDLPTPVLDWVRQNFPGANIDEAELVTRADAVSYDLRLSAFGQPDFEGTLRVQSVATPNTSDRLSQRASVVSRDVLAQSQGDRSQIADGVPRPAPTREGEPAVTGAEPGLPPEFPSQPAGNYDAPAEQARWRATVQQPSVGSHWKDTVGSRAALSAEAEWTYRVRHYQSTPAGWAVQVLLESSAGIGGAVWLPQVAGILRDALPMDIAAVERELQRVLDRIDSMATVVASDSVATNAAIRLAIIAVLFTGSDLVLLRSRRANAEPAFDANSADSSWSWIMGSATRRP
jgi:hypothetical protein